MFLVTSPSFGLQGGADEAQSPEEEPVGTAAADSAEKPADPTKQIRSIQKKLRQINQLKEKQAAGQQLDKSQLIKIASVGELEQELQNLLQK